MDSTTTDLLDSLGASTPMEAPIEEVDMNSQELTPEVALSAIEEKALKLLGIGVSNEKVAIALGVTAGRVSQLLSDEKFATRVANAKYMNLQQHSERDGKYDGLEDRLLKKLEGALPLMMRPETILKAMQVVNGAKRRGQQGVELASDKQQIVSLILPTQIVQQFQTNIHNQVTKAGDQELLTMSSASLLKQIEQTKDNLGLTHVPEHGK